jgi:hypothetical protein
VQPDAAVAVPTTPPTAEPSPAAAAATAGRSTTGRRESPRKRRVVSTVPEPATAPSEPPALPVAAKKKRGRPSA